MTAPTFKNYWRWDRHTWVDLCEKFDFDPDEKCERLATGVECYVFDFGHFVIKITPSEVQRRIAARLHKSPVSWIAKIMAFGQVSDGSNYHYIVQEKLQSSTDVSDDEFEKIQTTALAVSRAAALLSSIGTKDLLTQLENLRELQDSGLNPATLRDLGASNFAMDHRGRIKLIDLGSLE